MKHQERRTQNGRQKPGAKNHVELTPANPSKLIRSATPADDTPPRDPPGIAGLAKRLPAARAET